MNGRKTTLDLVVVVNEQFQKGQSQAAKIIIEHADPVHIKDQAWDLVPILCEYLTLEQEEIDGAVVTAAEDILLHLTTAANVKELLIVLLQQADTHKDDVKFMGLLAPIQQCITRMPGRRRLSISDTLEKLYAHLHALPLPAEMRLEGKEKVLLSEDDTVRRTDIVVTAFLSFLDPIVEEFHWKKRQLADPEGRAVAHEMTKCLLKLLDHPLAYHDLSHRPRESDDRRPPPKMPMRVCAEKLIKQVAKLQNNFPKMFSDIFDGDLPDERRKCKVEDTNDNNCDDGVESEDVKDVQTSTLSMGVFSYLAFGEFLEADCIPQVLTAEYLVDLVSTPATYMLARRESLIIHKGLSLLSGLLSRLPDRSLSGQILELPGVKELLQTIMKVMTSSEVKELATMSLNLFHCVLKKFDLSGRFQLILYVLKTSSHAGLCGVIITALKDQIDDSLKRGEMDGPFTGDKLRRLLKVVFTFPQYDNVDLLEENDKIMSALNLLRYLAIRDKREANVTGVWDDMGRIRSDYCDRLHQMIKLSRSEYLSEISKLREAKNISKATSIVLSVDNDPSEGTMTRDQQIQVLCQAERVHDVIESVLAIANDTLDQQMKIPSKTGST